MPTTRTALLVVVGALAVLSPAVPLAQDTKDVDILLDRLATYLSAYETQLTTVIAEESYVQAEFRQITPTRYMLQRQRRLRSEVAFLRLPDESTWFGVRDVRQVDGRAVSDAPGQLERILKHFDERRLEEAAQIVARSSAHNLGAMRTINMPTVPLEILHPDHYVQFAFKLNGRMKVERTTTVRVDFEEFDTPTIVKATDGSAVFINGSAWIDPETGALWRVDLTMSPHEDARLRRRFATNQVRVDFTRHKQLGMIVPKQMLEVFWMDRGRGEGRADYSNFRRFTTSGRIVPH